MKKLFTLLALLGIVGAVCAQNTWTQKANFSVARQSAMAFSIGTKGYLGLGYNPSNSNPTALWEFDPVTNIYTQKANYPGSSLQGNVAFSIGSKGYVGMGVSSGFANDFYEYDPATNVWTAKAVFPGNGRSDAFTFSINGIGYVGAGQHSNNFYNDFWAYDPVSNSWTQKAAYPGTPRWGVASFSIGNMGYACTGQSAAGDNYDVYQYNSVTNTWTQKSDFRGYGRGQAVGFTINGLGYLGTGSDYTGALRKDFWQYNPANDSWMQKTDFGGNGRWIAVGFSAGKKGYIGLGWRGNYANDLWEYMPDSLQASYYPTTTVCAGSPVPVSLLSGITFNSGNVFTVQLSNAAGSFASPVNIGTLTDTAGAVVSVTIPANTPAGAGYRIRVVSSSPVVVGADNGWNITINPQTVPTLSISTANTNVCAGNTVTLTSAATNQGVATYFWKVNGVSSGFNNGSFTYQPANGDVVTVMMTIPLLCSVEDTLISNAITFSVTPKVTPTISISAAAMIVCTGDSARMTAAITNGGTAPTYRWQLNATTITGNNTPNFNFLPANGDIVKCTLTSNFACLNSNNIASNQVYITVAQRVTPLVSITASPAAVCQGDSVFFYANTVYGGFGPAWQWTVNNIPAGISDANFAYRPANGDAVKCSLTSNQVCAITTNAVSNTISAVVHPLPATPSITRNGTTLATGSYASYQWYLDGVAITPGGNTQTISITQNGAYTVTVKDANTCSAGSASFPVGNLAVSSYPGAGAVQVYPNPVKEVLFINAPFPVDATLKDVVGRTVLQAAQSTRLDLQRLPEGNYILLFTDSQGRPVRTFRITR